MTFYTKQFQRLRSQTRLLIFNILRFATHHRQFVCRFVSPTPLGCVCACESVHRSLRKWSGHQFKWIDELILTHFQQSEPWMRESINHTGNFASQPLFSQYASINNLSSWVTQLEYGLDILLLIKSDRYDATVLHTLL